MKVDQQLLYSETARLTKALECLAIDIMGGVNSDNELYAACAGLGIPFEVAETLRKAAQPIGGDKC